MNYFGTNINSILHSFLGGNFGLFTGMSILSMFEIAFWVVRFIFGKSESEAKTTDAVQKKDRINGKKRRFGLQKKNFARQRRRMFQTEVGLASF